MSKDDTPPKKIPEPSRDLTRLDTATVLGSLQTLFKTVMSGDEYNKEQVKSATNLSNAMVKVLRFEFDAYKYFNNRTSG